MKKFAKIMLIALGFGLVTVALGFLTSSPAPAQFPPPVVPVKVTNTPLPVRDADDPGRNPVFGSCDLINVTSPGFQSCVVHFVTSTGFFESVPAGNRLVIDFVSGELDLPTGTIPAEYELRTSLGTSPAFSYADIIFDPRFVGPITSATDLYKISQQTRIYEDSGAQVYLDVTTNAPPGAQYSAFLTVTGHLVSE